MDDIDFKPISGMALPRFAGIASFMRLPYLNLEHPDLKKVDIGLIGIPWDGGTTNRPGARHGPRQMRDQSTLMRNVHHVSLTRPFQFANCADLGDTPVNPVDLQDTFKRIEKFFTKIIEAGIMPLSAGGDHLVSLPVLRVLRKFHKKPLSMIHFDAHTDTWDRYFGEYAYTHGTPFRRAIEEDLLDPKKIIQIGIRGALYTPEDKDWGLQQGIRVVEIEEYHKLGPENTMKLAHDIIGEEPTYISFDVDALDPVFAPGTGTPEIGGLSTFDAQTMLRMLKGINLIAGDVVEVSPPFDPSGGTALVGVTMMYEILCIMAEIIKQRKEVSPS
ncbi:MAG: agmatinase [Pseudomonadota bacterium]